MTCTAAHINRIHTNEKSPNSNRRIVIESGGTTLKVAAQSSFERQSVGGAVTQSPARDFHRENISRGACRRYSNSSSALAAGLLGLGLVKRMSIFVQTILFFIKEEFSFIYTSLIHLPLALLLPSDTALSFPLAAVRLTTETAP